MSFFSDLQAQLDALRALVGDVEAVAVPGAVSRLGDDEVVAVISTVSALAQACESLRIAASGVVAARSTREAGHSGLAQKRGHRSPASLVQELTGSTRADAVKQVRLGEALSTSHGDGVDGAGEGVDATEGSVVVGRPWHAPLSDALLGGSITAAQHDAILRGLGGPPAPDADGADSVDVVDDAADRARAAEQLREVWAVAAGELVVEAPHRTVEELARAARTLRDQLDPEGAQRRFEERFRARSFRMWTDADGIHRGTFSFDDHAAAWVRTIIDSALRPRRGGPRFVDPTEKARADELVADPRTNEQLAYDLLIGVLRTGALADAKAVFGTRQAGVRVVISAAARAAVADGRPGVGVLEEDQATLPAWLIEQHACDTGIVELRIDRDGNPLHLGREARLFSPGQRVALAIRDGGCRWKGCDRPASYCESHHIDHHAEGGNTDTDRGILLCRFHHMALHDGGWRITRDGLGDFVLHPPPGGGSPVVLKPRLALTYAWAGIDPPPPRFRPAA